MALVEFIFIYREFEMNKGIAVFLILVGGMNIASADDNVSQQIQLLNSQIQAQIQKSQSDQQVQIKELNKQIQAQLKQMQTDLQAQIQKSVSTKRLFSWQNDLINGFKLGE